VIVAIAGCRSSPESLSVTLTSNSSALAFGVAVAEEVGDPAQRAEILAVIAQGLQNAQNSQDALQVAVEAGRLINEVPVSAELVDLQLRIAELLLSVEETGSARRLIVEATSYAAAIRDETLRADLLVAIIQVAVRGEDDTRDLLPAVVDPVYVIEDTGLRAHTLIAVAEAYQAVGAGQSVTGLIQQAIPAIRSVPDAFRRAELFASLSCRAFAAGVDDLGSALVEDATEQLTDGMANANPGPDTVALVAKAVTRDRGGAQAMLVVSGLEDPRSRAAGFLAIGMADNAGQSAVPALNRAVQACGAIDDPRDFAAFMTSIAHAYLNLNRRREALAAANQAAVRVSANLSVMNNTETLGQLAGVYALLDLTDMVWEYLRQFDLPYFRGLIAVTVAELLISEGRQGVADDFLVDALLEADSSDVLADGLREKIARGFSRSGNYTLAIRTIERMSDPPLRARAVAYLGYYADSNGGLSGAQDLDLKSVLNL
jgi:tetratricopeptide (TPR) repeat protein